jgi:hypothetical protein
VGGGGQPGETSTSTSTHPSIVLAESRTGYSATYSSVHCAAAVRSDACKDAMSIAGRAAAPPAFSVSLPPPPPPVTPSGASSQHTSERRVAEG